MRAFIILVLLGSALAVPKTINRIVGGEDTSVEEYPFMANMQFGWFNIWFSQRCGGALFTDTAVLSAAHCFSGDMPMSWRVRLGTSLRSSGGLEFNVARIIMHPDYTDSTKESDVAVVWLGRLWRRDNLLPTGTIALARIAGRNYNLEDGTPITALGWGALWSGGPPSEQLQKVDINIVNQQLCAARYAYLKSQPNFSDWPDITGNMVCAGILNVGGKDACQGDSGGPVVHNRDVVFGVVSWGYGCADPFYPGVLARVGPLSTWIILNTV